jgi:hypothetical protein
LQERRRYRQRLLLRLLLLLLCLQERRRHRQRLLLLLRLLLLVNPSKQCCRDGNGLGIHSAANKYGAHECVSMDVAALNSTVNKREQQCCRKK